MPEPEATPRGGWNPLLEVRQVTPTDFLKGVFTDCVWARSPTPLDDDPMVHRAALTYLSDVGTGFGQQDPALIGRGGPSIDHALWFQENIRADDWVFLDLRPVKARSARGCYDGSMRDRDGLLGATLYQEQLLLPGSMTDLVEEVLRSEAEAAAVGGTGATRLGAVAAGASGQLRLTSVCVGPAWTAPPRAIPRSFRRLAARSGPTGCTFKTVTPQSR